MHIKEKAKYLIKYFFKKKRDIIPKKCILYNIANTEATVYK